MKKFNIELCNVLVTVYIVDSIKVTYSDKDIIEYIGYLSKNVNKLLKSGLNSLYIADMIVKELTGSLSNRTNFKYVNNNIIVQHITYKHVRRNRGKDN